MAYEDTKGVEELKGWHLDKRVPLGFIFALFVQTATFVWFLSDMNNDIGNNATDIVEIRQEAARKSLQIEALRRANENQSVLMGRVGVTLENFTGVLQRLENRLDNIEELVRENRDRSQIR